MNNDGFAISFEYKETKYLSKMVISEEDNFYNISVNFKFESFYGYISKL
jgi:hypothetical protein